MTTKVKRWAAMVLAVVGLGACAQGVPPSMEAEALIERARWTVEEFRASQEHTMKTFQNQLAKAEAVAVFPALYKAGFVIGAEGGNGILIAKDAGGAWGQPAFYTLGAGSIGFQIGGQVAETVLVIRSRKALEAIIKHQAKLGGDISVVGGTVGAGMEASTTTNAGADVVVFSRAAGAFGGVSVEGAVMAKRNDWNEAVYGTGATPAAIVLEGRFSTPKAQGLRDALAARK